MERSNIFALVVVGTFFLFVQSSATFRVCHGKYGCFSFAPPFFNFLMKLPQDPSIVKTTFHLFSRSNRHHAQLIDDSNSEKLDKSNFDISKRTIIICHGWIEDKYGLDGWGGRMKDALLEREDCNVILVDWSGGSRQLYGQAAGNTRLVGVQIGELIKFIINSHGGSKDLADRFYVIGFSLGGQIAGYAGKHLRDRRMVLGRITGLDPAGPYFSFRDPEVRLDPTDAKYVDVIHTNMPFVGTKQLVGHIDFFPNGGSIQPGCLRPLDGDILFEITCAHMRAPAYYTESVKNQCSWKAYPCSNYWKFWFGGCKQCNGECPSLGYDAYRTKKTGQHYLKTNSKEPFCGKS